MYDGIISNMKYKNVVALFKSISETLDSLNHKCFKDDDNVTIELSEYGINIDIKDGSYSMNRPLIDEPYEN